MGLTKRLYEEMLEQEHMDEWIRVRLDDPEAEEGTEEWAELEEKYLSNDYYNNDLGYDGYDDWYVAGKTRFTLFNENMSAAAELLNIGTIRPNTYRNLIVMVYAHVIASVEGYLSSAFIDKALSDEKYIRLLVETDPSFGDKQFSIKDIFKKKESLKSEISKYLKDIIFHDLRKVKPMYQSVLGIDFKDISWLFKAVLLRHDCVHRAGYDKDGNEACLTKETTLELIVKSKLLINDVELEMENLPKLDGDIQS